MATLTLGAASYWFAAHRLESSISASTVLGVALLLRLCLLPLPPTLSDDILRYVWDGRVVAAGFDPYRLAPDDDSLAPLRDDLWNRMPHKEIPTVYPPLALLSFTIAAMAPSPLWGVKILLCLAELIGCAILIRLAVRLTGAPGRAAWYAWNPLVVLEVAGQGHVDGLMVTCAILAVACLAAKPSKEGLAGLFAALGGMAKLVPFAALPLWARSSRRPWRFLGVAVSVVVLGLIPLLYNSGLPRGLVAYGVRWEFNGPLYEPLWRLVEKVDPIDEIKGGLDRAKEMFGAHAEINRLYPFVYPQFLAKLLLASLFGVIFLLLLRYRRPPAVVAERFFGAVLLCSATVYPWYVLWVLPWAALGRRRPWLLLSCLVPLSYLPQHAEGIALFPWVWALIWIPVLLFLSVDRSWSTD